MHRYRLRVFQAVQGRYYAEESKDVEVSEEVARQALLQLQVCVPEDEEDGEGGLQDTGEIGEGDGGREVERDGEVGGEREGGVDGEGGEDGAESEMEREAERK